MAKTRRSWLILLGGCALYGALYFIFGRLQFPIRKDELHFWPTSLMFSHTLLPTLEQLRNYNDLNTPFPFVWFGVTEFLFGQGIWLGRLTNFTLAFICLLFIALPLGKKPSPKSLFCSVGLFLCPYFLAVSTHLYTDMFAMFFGLLGVVLFCQARYWLSGSFFLLAISSRQYAVVYPLALALYFGVELFREEKQRDHWKAWLIPALCSLSLGGWFVFFGGPGPRVAIRNQHIETASGFRFLFHNAGYFLACLGLYFVLVESFFFKADRQALMKHFKTKRSAALLAALFVFFVLFPPLGNPAGYGHVEMGYLDKFLRLFLNDFFRCSVLFLLASLSVVRFQHWSLASCLVFLYAALMVKAHIGWDKYALLPLVVLWWLKSVSEIGEQAFASLPSQILPGGRIGFSVLSAVSLQDETV